jgi:hypothetical protein
MSFAAAVRRANSAVLKHLGEKQAALDNLVVRGIFDRPFLQVAGGIDTSQPTFTLATADAERAQQGSTLRLDGGAAYRVTNIEPDGTGITVLRLELAA